MPPANTALDGASAIDGAIDGVTPAMASALRTIGTERDGLACLMEAIGNGLGDPFTAADAKFSLDRTYDPAAKTRVNTVFTTVDRTEAPDAATLLVHAPPPFGIIIAEPGRDLVACALPEAPLAALAKSWSCRPP